MADLVDRVAALLVGRFGIVPGNRVLLRAPNNPWLVVCWLATLKAGAVVVTTMPMLRPSELTAIAEIARVDLALCDARFLDDLRRPTSAARRSSRWAGTDLESRPTT